LKIFEIPAHSRREFSNSREFPWEFLGWRIPGNSRTGIPGGPDVGYNYRPITIHHSFMYKEAQRHRIICDSGAYLVYCIGKMLFSVNIHGTLKYLFVIFRENSWNTQVHFR